MNKTKKFLIYAVVVPLIAFALLLPLVAFAQVATTGDAPVTLEALLSQLFGSISTWKASGWLAGAVALVNVLTNLTKWEPVNNLLGKKWWLRPLVAVVLGIAVAFFAKYAGGASIGMAVVIAIFSGLSSTGFHEFMTQFSERIRIERAIGAKVLEVTKTITTAEAPSPSMTDLKSKLDEISKMTDEKTRVTALSNLANS